MTARFDHATPRAFEGIWVKTVIHKQTTEVTMLDRIKDVVERNASSFASLNDSRMNLLQFDEIRGFPRVRWFLIWRLSNDA